MTTKHKREKTRPLLSYPIPQQQKIKAILRNLPSDLAFQFYEEIGKPTGQAAFSLLDFCSKLASVESPQTHSSLKFHMKRGDLANWMKQTLGDSELAYKINKISPNDRSLAKKLHKTVNDRIKQLKDALIEHSIVPEDHLSMAHFERVH